MSKRNTSQKGLILQVIIGVLAIFALGVFAYFYITEKIIAPIVSNEKNLEKGNIPVSTPVDTTNKNKVFNLDELEFSYPSNLNFNRVGDTIILGHTVPKKHINSCDLKDGLSIDDVSDFNTSIKIFNKNLKDSVLSNESDYISKNYLKDNTLDLSQGFITKFKIGNLDGFKITMGLEGCGVDNYYFPLSATKTLFVSKNFYLETYPESDRSSLSTIPGFINGDQEQLIFNNILSTIKGLESVSTLDIKVYFRKDKLVCSENNINLVPFIHVIPKTQTIANESLNELFNGPTEVEKGMGYWTDIPEGTRVKSISIVDGTAEVDLNDKIESGITNCNKGGTRMSQIKQTLMQFPTIQAVKFSVEGKTKNLLQP